MARPRTTAAAARIAALAATLVLACGEPAPSGPPDVTAVVRLTFDRQRPDLDLSAAEQLQVDIRALDGFKVVKKDSLLFPEQAAGAIDFPATAVIGFGPGIKAVDFVVTVLDGSGQPVAGASAQFFNVDLTGVGVDPPADLYIVLGAELYQPCAHECAINYGGCVSVGSLRPDARICVTECAPGGEERCQIEGRQGTCLQLDPQSRACVPACTADGDCPAPLVCDRGAAACVSPCDDDLDCPAGGSCDTSARRCQGFAACPGTGCPMLEAVGTGIYGPVGLVVVGNRLYSIAQGTASSGYSDGQVASSALDGSDFLDLADAQARPIDLAVDDTHVYFANLGSGQIQRVPVGGGPVQPVAQGQHPYGIALDADSLYWVNTADGTVMKVAKSGGPTTQLATGQIGPVAIAVDGGIAYWLNLGGTDPETAPDGQGQLVAAGTDGATEPQVLTEGLDRPRRLIVTADAVYWVNAGAGGQVMRYDRGTTDTIELAAQEPMPVALALDGQQLYFLDATGQGMAGIVRQVLVTGGGVTEKALTGGGATALALDPMYVYWAEPGLFESDGAIYRLPR
jgi:hypothetical protein